MCIRDSLLVVDALKEAEESDGVVVYLVVPVVHDRRDAAHGRAVALGEEPVSYTHLRAHETVLDLVCRLLLEKKTNNTVISKTCVIETIWEEVRKQQLHTEDRLY